MKYIYKSITVFLIGLIFSYLITSYVNGSFDISVLTKEAKVLQITLFALSQLISNLIIYNK